MKQLLSLFTVALLSFVTLAYADRAKDTSTRNNIRLEKKTYQVPGSVNRMPMQLELIAYYDSADSSIHICSDDDIEAEVYVFEKNMQIDYRSETNAVIPIPDKGIFNIAIIGDNWTATGSICL